MSIEKEYDSNFRYVLVAARRARQLQNGAEPMVPTRSRKACRVAQEEIGRGAPPLGVAWGEVVSDVSFADRSQKSVSEGMQPRVGVGVTDEAPVVGDLHAAEPQVVARSEPVGVEALPDAHRAHRSG